MRFAWRTLVLSLTALTFTACATGGRNGPPVLEGTTWRVVQVDGQRVDKGDDVDLAPHFRVISEDGMVHGATGCNRFSATYQATGTTFGLGPMAMTRALCGDPGRQWVEDHIVEVMAAADGYRMQDGWLWITVGGQARLTAEVW